MRLLILTRTYPPNPGAVGHLVKELCEALIKNDWQIAVVTSGIPHDSDSVEFPLKICRVKSLPFTRKNHLLRALSYLSLYPSMLWTAACQRRPDVIVTTTDPPLQAVVGVLLKVFFRCKLVHWCQDLYPEMAEEAGILRKGGLLAKMLRWISTQTLKHHDRVVSIGRCMTQRLVIRGIAAEKMTEIQNWTDPEWIHPVPEQENDFWIREKLKGRFVVVYSGNLGLAHSFKEILDAAKLLQTESPEVLFLFIGDGPRRAEVEAGAKMRLLSNVKFLPAQSWGKISESLSAGQVHLVSLRENLTGLVVPSKFYGIMAAGRPCIFIGPPDCEVARLIAEKGVGEVVQTRDALVAAIREYGRHPQKQETEGIRARLLGENATLAEASLKFSRILNEH